MKANFKNKKILYLGQRFFGYEKEIINSLEKMGAIVDFFDERPTQKNWYKFFLKIKLKKLLTKYIRKYFENIMLETKDIDYDFIFINKLETIDFYILNNIRKYHPQSCYILYNWDSVDNYNPDIKAFNLFDKIFTFDSVDACKYAHFKLLPLFYINTYKDLKKQNKEYDFCFIGSGHSDRYLIVEKLKENLIGKEFFTFYYLKTIYTYFFRKLLDKRMRATHINDFSFKALNQNEIVDYIAKSHIIIDIEHPTQSGLTMRTIEVLGAKKKLITTNKNIKKYDFYNPNNIYIIDRLDPKVDHDFINKPYIEISSEIYEKYSLENWLITIFLKDN